MNSQSERDTEFRRALLEAQAETTLDGLLVVDADRNVLYHNDRFLDMWGIPEEVAARRSDRVLLEYVDSLLADPEAFYDTVEYLYEHPGETTRDTVRLADGRWFERYSAPVVGSDGTNYGRLWTFRNATERKARENQLRETREMLRSVQQTMASSAPLTDKMADLLAFGRQYLGVEHGFFARIDDGEMRIRAASGPNEQLQAGQSAPLSAAYCRHTVDPATEGSLTVEHASEEGWSDDPAFERFELECYVGSTVSVDDEVYGTVCFADRDPAEGEFTEPQQTFLELLTEWAGYELQQRERERQYRRLTERVSDAYYAFDPDWTVTYWNDAVADRTGVPAGEIVGTNFWDQFPELEGTAYAEALREAMQSQNPRSCEFYYEEGGYWVELQAYPADEGISVISQEITERKERERELQQQRDELAQLQRLNTLVREINGALQDETTRDGIERAVCDRLVDSALYQAAWVGVSDDQAGGPTVVPRTSAGVGEAYLEDVPGGERGPARRALETGEVQVVSDVASAEDFPDSRREIALEHDHRTLAAVPLATGDVTHGVLVVYAPPDHAIDDRERAVLGDFGQTIARAIQRVHSQRSLTADTAVELDFRVRDDENVFSAVSADLACEIELDRYVPAAASADIYYLEVRGADEERVADRLAESPLLERCTVVTDVDGAPVEAVRTDRDGAHSLPLDVFVDHGASLDTARADDGDLRYSVTVSPEMSVRTLREALADVAPAVELVGKRLVDQPVTTVPEVKDAVRAQLTPKQEAALETAYARGYYEWPRTSNAEEVADVLDVSASTLHYHLRRAHQAVLAALFEEYEPPATQ